MNICIVTQQLKNVYSGIGLHAKNLIKDLLNHNHKITVVVPESQVATEFTECDFVTISDSKLITSQARWVVLSSRISKQLKQLEKQQVFDLIHFTDVRDSFFCNTFSPTLGNLNDTYVADLRTISYYKEHYFDWFTRYFYYYFVHQIEKRKLQLLDGIIANSQFTLNTIQNNYLLNANKVHFCYKSVDINRYQHIVYTRRKKLGSKVNPKVLFVGGNMQRKGLLVLIKSAPLIKKLYPTIAFNIAGYDKYLPKYKQICSSYNVLENFKFLGWVSQDDLLDLYQNATLFVMPSLTEALGVVFFEAMAAGVPVIGTNVGGIPEIIHNGMNGLLVPENSAEHLAEGIIKLISDTRFANELSTNGLKTVQKFSTEKMMECTYQIYSKLI